jgi:hypothetical protein
VFFCFIWLHPFSIDFVKVYYLYLVYEIVKAENLLTVLHILFFALCGATRPGLHKRTVKIMCYISF